MLLCSSHLQELLRARAEGSSRQQVQCEAAASSKSRPERRNAYNMLLLMSIPQINLSCCVLPRASSCRLQIAADCCRLLQLALWLAPTCCTMRCASLRDAAEGTKKLGKRVEAALKVPPVLAIAGWTATGVMNRVLPYLDVLPSGGPTPNRCWLRAHNFRGPWSRMLFPRGCSAALARQAQGPTSGV